MIGLQLSRMEQAHLYIAMCAALGVPDDIETPQQAMAEARSHAFVYLQPYDFLEASILADTIDDYIHQSGAELYSIRVEQVAELANCTADVAKRALGFLGLVKSPVHGPRIYTNAPTGYAAEMKLPPDLFIDWRQIAW
ncbi:MAG: hypothetical protein JWS10_89 [Cypionkella sp.]|uniref:hypothetical protein n=1 Tax=Cypionkella sp. TaxID=2811411 RepID=UPI002624B90A|nr:hypothetical protein [Cypionkella sp.]MDB5657474.1 hypothetical protein [Cypionkella sp.]